MLTAIKGEINSNTILVLEFNTPISPMDRSSKMQINRETQALNDTLNKMFLNNIYRTFHPKTTEYMLLSSAQGTFSRIDHISLVRNKALVNLRKLKSYQVSFPATTL